MRFSQPRKSPTIARWLPGAILALALLPSTAYAGHPTGAALDTISNVLAWVVLIFAPIIGIGAFLLVHILPEKIAEKKQHPQLDAIKTLCLLSLVFGGMLWPLAWLWAYSKPVMYKLAYGTDKAAHGEGAHAEPAHAAPAESEAADTSELHQLRQRLAEVENRMAGWPSAQRGG